MRDLGTIVHRVSYFRRWIEEHFHLVRKILPTAFAHPLVGKISPKSDPGSPEERSVTPRMPCCGNILPALVLDRVCGLWRK